MYLINTMVLSELRRRQRDPGVVAWIARQQHLDPWRGGSVMEVVQLVKLSGPAKASGVAGCRRWRERWDP